MLIQDWPTLDVLRLRYIAQVLERHGGNKTRAADMLGIDRRTLNRILARERAKAAAAARGYRRIQPISAAAGEAPVPIAMGETPKPPARPLTMGETPKPPARPLTMGESAKPSARPEALASVGRA